MGEKGEVKQTRRKKKKPQRDTPTLPSSPVLVRSVMSAETRATSSNNVRSRSAPDVVPLPHISGRSASDIVG